MMNGIGEPEERPRNTMQKVRVYKLMPDAAEE